jgi:hypothetical protein
MCELRDRLFENIQTETKKEWKWMKKAYGICGKPLTKQIFELEN